MTAFTRHLSALGLDLPASDSERLEQDFPALEHGLAGQTDLSAAFPSDAIALLIPADDSQSCRSALESLLTQRLASGGPALVLDLDISSPHEQFLGAPNHEGLSDHFLYGVSRDKLLRDSQAFPGVRVITPGTYTPRAADIYRDRKWQGLLDWLSGSGDGPLVLIAPPFSRYSDFSFLPAVGSALLVTSDEPASVSALPDRLSVIYSRLPESSNLRVLWSSGLSETSDGETTTSAAGSDSAMSENQETAPDELFQDNLSLPEEPAAEPELSELSTLPGEKFDLDSAILQEESLPEELTLPEEPADLPELPELSTLPEEELDLDNPIPLQETSPEEMTLPEELPPDELVLPEEPAAETGLPELSTLPEEELDLDNPIPQQETSPEEMTLPEELPPDELTLPEESSTLPEEEFELDGLAGLTEMPESRSELPSGSSGEEDEIFLPRELLFLDEEDERRGAETVTRAGVEGKSFEQELNDLSRGELPDLPPEPHPVNNAPPRQAIPAPVEPRPGSATKVEEDFEPEAWTDETQEAPDISEALFTDDGQELDEEQPAAARPSNEMLDPAQAEQALQKMEGFEEALSAPDELEDELHLDVDPLAESAIVAEEEPEPLETTSLPGEETDLDLEATPLPGDEAGTLPKEEIPTLEDDSIEELEPGELETAPQSDLETAELGDDLTKLPDSGPPDQTIAPLDEVDIENLEVELDKANIAPSDKGALVELDDEGVPQAAPARAPSKAAAAARDNLAGPKINNLLNDNTDLADLDTDIDLGDAAIPEVVPKFDKPRKKGRKKKSAARSLVWITLLLMMTGGLFMLWKEGTVSLLLRRSPLLNELLGKAGITLPGLQDNQAETATQTAPDTMTVETPVTPQPELQSYEYSIQVGSYRFLPQALEARNRLVQGGLPDVFVTPLVLDSLGSWNRLYVGCFTSSEQADTALARILPELRKSATAADGSSQAIKRRTPWAINLGDFGQSDSLETLRTRLAGFDIPSYAIQISADSSGVKKFRLYVGAFEDQEQAVYIRTRLFNIGVNGSIEEREGPLVAPAPTKPPGQV